MSKLTQKTGTTLTTAKLNSSDDVCQTSNSIRVFNVSSKCSTKGCSYTTTVTIYPRTSQNEAALKKVVGRARSC